MGIVLYGAECIPSAESIIHIDMGFYKEGTTSDEDLKINNIIVLKRKITMFCTDGKKPLKIVFLGAEPTGWTCKENSMEISFEKLKAKNTGFCTFVLQKEADKVTEPFTCYFKIQQGKLVEKLTLLLKAGDKASTPISSTNVAGRVSPTPKKRETSPTRQQQEGREVDTNIFQYLSGQIVKDWQKLGKELEFTNEELSIINIDNGRDGHEQLVTQMLLKWRRKHGRNATYMVLGEALKAAGLTHLQEHILKQLPTCQPIVTNSWK